MGTVTSMVEERDGVGDPRAARSDLRGTLAAKAAIAVYVLAVDVVLG